MNANLNKNKSLNRIPEERYLRVSGTPYQVGLIMGEALESQLANDIDHYLNNGPLKFGEIDPQNLTEGAMAWFDSLPRRFRKELEGLADGSGVPLQRIAEWNYADADSTRGCTGFLIRRDGEIWLGRNNDLWVPDLWGYAVRRQITGRLGTINFGMRGELFAATGLNQAGLWLHYNWLPSFETVAINGWTPYVLLTELLETCKNIDEVETRLKETTRTGGMLIFALEGKQGSGAIIECSPTKSRRQNLEAEFLAGTNHYQYLPTPQHPGDYTPESVARLDAIRNRLQSLPHALSADALISVLSDPKIEQHREDYGTVYANLYHPASQQVWFTFGGFPAASNGNWHQIPWAF
jgi:predicted choloylglycine hydrolase